MKKDIRKAEELFEALGELDSDIVADARHIGSYDENVIVVKRVPLWKTITGWCASAAGLAVLAVGGVKIAGYIGGGVPASPGANMTDYSSTCRAFVPAEYPEDAKYVFKGDYSELLYAFGVHKADGSVSLMPDFFGSHDEMAAASDLIVSGQFVDHAHQTYDPYDEDVIPDSETPSYNTLYIDKVVKGDVKQGDCIAVKQITHVYKTMTYSDWDMSPMICGDKWIYFLVMGEDGYYISVTPKQGRYPLPFAANKQLQQVNGYGYYDSPGNTSDPNIDSIYADTLEAFGLGASENFDGVELSVMLNDNKFGSLDTIKVKATVRNTTDKPIGLYMGCQGENTHEEIKTTISCGEYSIPDIDVVGKGFDTAEDVRIVQPGEEYVQDMTFGEPVWSSMRPKSGKYKGTAAITLLSDPNDTSSAAVTHSVEFSLRIGDESPDTDPDESDNKADVTKVYEWGMETESWTMDEFPDEVFRCDGDAVSVEHNTGIPEEPSSYTLYSGMPIMDVYLVDLNGDGKREIVSSAAFGSGMIDSRLYAFDFANDVCYTLCDRGNYDFTLYIDKGGLFVRKTIYYDRGIVLEEPLTLDMMTAEDKSYVYKGEESAEWTMDEFPGITFRADRTGIFACREGSENAILSDLEFEHINSAYLSDTDGDGRREMILEYTNENGVRVSRIISPDGSLAEHSPLAAE